MAKSKKQTDVVLDRCPRCDTPTHASESDDSGLCAKCSREVPAWARGLDMRESYALSKRLHVSEEELEKSRKSASYRRPTRLTLERTGHKKGTTSPPGWFVHIPRGIHHGGAYDRIVKALTSAGMTKLQITTTGVWVGGTNESTLIATLVASGFEVA